MTARNGRANASEEPVKEPAEQLTGRRAIALALQQAGIDTMFTVAGGHFLPAYHEMGRLDGLRVVAARHEQGAGYMASGYALATGRPGVVLSGAPGPGATNLVTAVANAGADSIPLVVLTAQVDRRYVNRNILQYCDNVALFEPFCKRSVQAASVEEVPNLLATSLQLAASGRPGPVHVAIPQNLQAETARAWAPVPVCAPAKARPGSAEVDELAGRIATCRRPAILAGHGVLRSRAAPGLVALAERLGAPVATSRSGIGAIGTGHALSVGMLGFYGAETARAAVGQADLVLVLGCALGEQTTFGWRADLFAPEAELVQVDADPAQLNRVYRLDQGVTADAGTLIDALAAALDEQAAPGQVPPGQTADGQAAAGQAEPGQAAAEQAKPEQTALRQAGPGQAAAGRAEPRQPWFGRRPEPSPPGNDPARGLSAAEVIGALNARSPADAVVTADIGNHRLWVCDQLDVRQPDGLLQSCEFDAMGFSLPAAIGAAVALPGTKVVSIAGDGGFVHTMGELTVAAELDLPVTAVVFVDGALGILRHQAEAMYGEDHCVRLAPIDFAAYAQACGIKARSIQEPADLDKAFQWAMESPGPVLLSVAIDPEEVFPPLQAKIEQRRRDLLGQT